MNEYSIVDNTEIVHVITIMVSGHDYIQLLHNINYIVNKLSLLTLHNFVNFVVILAIPTRIIIKSYSRPFYVIICGMFECANVGQSTIYL